ncbi:MAG: tetratricopeptide repeat protein, partial [Cyanobacteria bacterium J06582_2]
LSEYQKALGYIQKSLRIQQQIGDRYGEGLSLMNLGSIKSNLQQISESKTAFEKALKIYQEIGLNNKVEECNRAIQELENED